MHRDTFIELAEDLIGNEAGDEKWFVFGFSNGMMTGVECNREESPGYSEDETVFIHNITAAMVHIVNDKSYVPLKRKFKYQTYTTTSDGSTIFKGDNGTYLRIVTVPKGKKLKSVIAELNVKPAHAVCVMTPTYKSFNIQPADASKA